MKKTEIKGKRYSFTIETKGGQIIKVDDAIRVSIGDTVEIEKEEFSCSFKFKDVATIKSFEEHA